MRYRARSRAGGGRSAVLVGLLGLCVGWACAADEPDESEDVVVTPAWPQWRGPLGTGVAPDADPPVTWSADENIRWKTTLPGRGHSTPIVARDRVYITAAEPYGDDLEPAPFNVPPEHDNVGVYRRHRFLVLALDRSDGHVVWRRAVHEDLPHEGGHASASLASASPVTDGELVIASFGSNGLYALDREGLLVWEKDLGEMHTKHKHGEGSSPALCGDLVLVNWDHEGPSFVVALDKRTGEERWRAARDEVTSWSTPIVTTVAGREQVIVSATGRVRGYDAETGEVVWECGGMSNNVVASPVVEDGILIAGSSYEKKEMIAVRLLGATGDVTGSDAVLWTRRRGTPYVPSPLALDGRAYFLNHYQNVLSVVDVHTGRDSGGPYRLGELHNIYASPVAAAGRVYITDLDGTTLVLGSGDQPEMLAVNRLDDVISASAAIAGDELYLRGEHDLYCIGAPRPSASGR